MRGLQGHLDLVCGPDSRGVSSLRRQSFRAPMHLSKPHLDAGVLVVNIVNPTAGLLQGDRVSTRVEVQRGGRLLLTTPSASRAHRMVEGCAELEQHIRIAADAFLEFWPELFIPQAGTSFQQHTQIEVEEGGELLFFESLAPGRVAAGEAFAFREIRWHTEIRHGSHRIVHEVYRLRPEEEAVLTLRRIFPEAYYASGFVVSPRLTPAHSVWRDIHELHSGQMWIGCSGLSQGGCVVKVVAADSVTLRRGLDAIRQKIYAALEHAQPSLRRTGAT